MSQFDKEERDLHGWISRCMDGDWRHWLSLLPFSVCKTQEIKNTWTATDWLLAANKGQGCFTLRKGIRLL
jgi:hypothetical protein